MGEARRRKLAGTYPAQDRAQEPAGSDVTGVTYFPAGAGDPVFISIADAKRRMGRKPDA